MEDLHRSVRVSYFLIKIIPAANLLMTESKKTETLPKSDVAPDPLETAGGDDSEEPEEPAPEPWTPERVLEWNAYYDIYVMLAVLLLAFLVSANRIGHSSIFPQLQLGNVMAAKSAPVTTDPFSYTEEGKAWVNIPWLFEWSHAGLFAAGADLSPTDPNDLPATAAKAEQVGAGLLITLNALARVITALLLLGIRHKGIGKWWSAVCVTMAIGIVVSPAGLMLGGIAGPAIVSPETWGLLLLSIELVLLFRAMEHGSKVAAISLIPLFLLWANFDDSFLVGLLILAAVTLGRLQASRSRSAAGQNFPLPLALGVLLASALVCLVNPSFYRIYPASLSWLFSFFGPGTGARTIDQFSYFGNGIREMATKESGELGARVWKLLLTYYIVFVGIGFLSFWLNRRRFNHSRFLAYIVSAVLWAVMIRFAPEFALVFAATLALNGQEWYRDVVGQEGHIGVGWSLWSVGGRMVTISALFGGTWMALTGYGLSASDGKFGFGFDKDTFAFEAAELLKSAPIQGNVLNTTLNQGDALIWRAYPARKTFMDGRRHLFEPALYEKLDALKRALRDDDVEVWKKILDEYKVSVVMIQPTATEITYRTLSRSRNWIPFHDDGNTVLFGRADAAEPADLAYFKANQLDPDLWAYKLTKPTPPVDRPPSPVTWMDNVFQTRALARPQPHNASARRWLLAPDIDMAAGAMPEPARCLLAVREARAALASKPDDSNAYRLLADAYRMLMIQDSVLLDGKKLPVETTAQIANVPLRAEILMTRFRQRVTAISYAIQTTPPPQNDAARLDLARLHFELGRLFGAVSFFDLSRDRFQTALDLAAKSLSAEERAQYAQQVSLLSEQVAEIQKRMNDMAVEQQAGPLQLALYAIGQGAPGLALHELEEADRTGTNPNVVKPQLLDLYCDTGQPDKAVEMLNSGQISDPIFGSEPGVSPMRQGRAYFLLGNAESASTLWEKYALPPLRYDRGVRSLGTTMAFLKGDPLAATTGLLEIPEKVRLQAAWEFDDGMCRLEQGMPELAAEHLTKALTLAPKLPLRPVIAYYLEKLGQPVPPEEPVVPPAKPAASSEKPKEAEKK